MGRGKERRKGVGGKSRIGGKARRKQGGRRRDGGERMGKGRGEKAVGGDGRGRRGQEEEGRWGWEARREEKRGENNSTKGRGGGHLVALPCPWYPAGSG